CGSMVIAALQRAIRRSLPASCIEISREDGTMPQSLSPRSDEAHRGTPVSLASIRLVHEQDGVSARPTAGPGAPPAGIGGEASGAAGGRAAQFAALSMQSVTAWGVSGIHRANLAGTASLYTP